MMFLTVRQILRDVAVRIGGPTDHSCVTTHDTGEGFIVEWKHFDKQGCLIQASVHLWTHDPSCKGCWFEEVGQ